MAFSMRDIQHQLEQDFGGSKRGLLVQMQQELGALWLLQRVEQLDKYTPGFFELWKSMISFIVIQTVQQFLSVQSQTRNIQPQKSQLQF